MSNVTFMNSTHLFPASGTHRWSIVIVTGQHRDEFAGMEAGAKMIEYVAASLRPWGATLRLNYSQPDEVSLPPLDLREITVLAIPHLNPSPWSTRLYGAFPASGREILANARVESDDWGVDLNRSWPTHPVVASAWREIQALQALGGPVVVLDVHSSWQDRYGDDGVPDGFLYARDRARAYIEPIATGWRIESSPEPGALEDVALAAGMYGITVELGEDDGTPAIAGCDLLRRIVAAGPPREA